MKVKFNKFWYWYGRINGCICGSENSKGEDMIEIDLLSIIATVVILIVAALTIYFTAKG